MSRRPLQSVNTNVHRPSFPIFDDLKSGPIKQKLVPVSKSTNERATNIPVQSSKDSRVSKLFIATILAQNQEIKMCRKREAFLRLTNHLLSCRQRSQAPRINPESPRKHPESTPKKRRLEEEHDESDVENTGNYQSSSAACTPGRLGVSTPHRNARKQNSAQTPSETIHSTPRKSPLKDISNIPTYDHAQLPPRSGSKMERHAMPSLAERLKCVEESLHQLSTADNQKDKPMPNSSQSTSSSTSSNENNIPSKQTTIPTNEPAPSREFFDTPVIAEHLVLQAAIHKATRNSIKTLLKGRDLLPVHSEYQDALAVYQQDTAKVQHTLRQRTMGNNIPITIQQETLENSITNYSHTQSELFPLSPLGEQSERGTVLSPIALSSMTILQGKLEDWRSKYTKRSTAASTIGK